MANEYVVNSTDLTSVADAIREKAGVSDSFAFPDGFVEAVSGISAGGISTELLTLTSGKSGSFTPTENIMSYELTGFANITPKIVFVYSNFASKPSLISIAFQFGVFEGVDPYKTFEKEVGVAMVSSGDVNASGYLNAGEQYSNMMLPVSISYLPLPFNNTSGAKQIIQKKTHAADSLKIVALRESGTNTERYFAAGVTYSWVILY